MHGKQKRIRWNTDERQRLVAEALRIRRVSDRTFLAVELLHRAQEVLPQERRRSIVSPSQIGWFIRALDQQEDHSTDQAAAKEPRSLEAQIGAAIVAFINEEFSRFERDTLSFIELLRTDICRIDDALRLLINRLEELERKGEAPTAAEHLERISFPKGSSIAAPSIAVVGLLPAQQEQCRRLAAEHNVGKVHLSFISRKRNVGLHGTYDYMVLMTKFIAHTHIDQARHVMPQNRILFCTGGVSQLIKLLRTTVAQYYRSMRSAQGHSFD